MFLFLQGPHGPFLYRLGQMLAETGAVVWRVGFNAGDEAFWANRQSYIPFLGEACDWPERFRQLLSEKAVTDIVLYGDTRPFHAQAIEIARAARLTIHVFEEGYMRPYWVTYERDGSNGNSRLMEMSLSEMKSVLAASDLESIPPPASWGDMRQHVFYGAAYHGFVLFLNRKYRHFRSHRALGVRKEFALNLRRLFLMPVHAIERRLATWRIRKGGYPYHIALLQLEHDSSFIAHSPFRSMTDFLEVVIDGFARGAPAHHHLVVKAHPLEDGRAPLRTSVKELAKEHGLEGRVHFVPGGKLAQLLDEARSAVTVNSTAAQQALWRGIPLRCFGKAVYAKPEFVSHQPLPEFFAHPDRPDRRAYAQYRRFLLASSQIPGGFYSTRGRRQIQRHVIDMMLASKDPYDALTSGTEASVQQLRAIS